MTYYTYQWTTNPNNKNTDGFYLSGGGGDTLSTSVNRDIAPGTYWWHVYAYNSPSDYTSWSPDWKFTVEPGNTCPEITMTGLSPTTGDTTDTYTFTLKYEDADNDPPKTGYPKVYIDGVSHTMTAVNPSDTSYDNGKDYTFSITGNNLGEGNHNHYYKAYDTENCEVRMPGSGSNNGPTIDEITGEPKVTTKNPTDVKFTTARLNGYLDDLGGTVWCTVWFEYGQTSS